MAELTALAVENYTQGRLHRDDAETARLLAAALGAARRYCGWHVTPLKTADPITMDGPGSRLLVLPTLRLTAITELSEDGVVLDVDVDIEWSARGLVRKTSRGWWCEKFGGITAKITHGYDDAPDWQAAVLSLVDRWSDLPAGGGATVIGPFQYPTREAAGEAFTATERYILDLYALEPAP